MTSENNSYWSSLSSLYNSTYSLTSKIAYNTMHAIQPASYAYLGAATLVELPVTGQVKPAIVALFATSNIFSRCQESSQLLEGNKHAVAHHHHEIMADYIVSLGIAAGSYALTQHDPQMAKYIISTFFATNVAFSGENSPIDYLKSGITSGLDIVLGDVF